MISISVPERVEKRTAEFRISNRRMSKGAQCGEGRATPSRDFDAATASKVRLVTRPGRRLTQSFASTSSFESSLFDILRFLFIAYIIEIPLDSTPRGSASSSLRHSKFVIRYSAVRFSMVRISASVLFHPVLVFRKGIRMVKVVPEVSGLSASVWLSHSIDPPYWVTMP